MSPRRGFTLIELLVVIAVLGIASTIGFRLLYRSGEIWNTIDTRVDLDAQVSLVFEAIRNDLGLVLSPERTGIGLALDDRTYDADSRFLRVGLEDDLLLLPLRLEDRNSGRTGYAEVRYRVDRSTNELLRVVGPLGMERETEVELPVADGVLDFGVAFHDGEAWHDEWTRAEAPRRIRVTITLAPADDPGAALVREAVMGLPL